MGDVGRGGEALSAAFATLGRIYKIMPTATREYPKQGGIETVLTNCERNHLRSAMDLYVALFYAIKNFASALALSRLGTHSIEGHFGMVRCAGRASGVFGAGPRSSLHSFAG
jgi:hypothetical protein